MNYFAHGRKVLDDPYCLAGTALPDWLSVVDRRVRLRPRAVAGFVADADPCMAAVARGVALHHADDAWFHATPAFAELSWELTARVRDVLPGDEGFRPSFLGHILVELLLDAALIAETPARLDVYYASLARIDPAIIQQAVNRMAPRPAARLAELLPLFLRERFLFDYLDDGRLCFRLNQVMHRVRLPPLPDSLRGVLPVARRLVAARRDDLLTPPAQNHA